jgi:ADP-ribose pyrophosphatase YjhB (NUDIX family)
LPGGGVKRNESYEDAVKREIMEELDLEIKPEYLGEYKSRLEYKLDTVQCYVVKITKVHPIIDNLEIKDAKWWRLDSLPEFQSTGLRKILEMYNSKIRN